MLRNIYKIRDCKRFAESFFFAIYRRHMRLECKNMGYISIFDHFKGLNCSFWVFSVLNYFLFYSLIGAIYLKLFEIIKGVENIRKLFFHKDPTYLGGRGWGG